MTQKMNNVGQQSSAKKLNPKVLSGGEPRGDEGKDALLREDDNDCVENGNIINSILRTNADGLSMPHMFLENEQVPYYHAQNATHGMTHYYASFNRKSSEEQNITKTAFNRNSFDYALSSKPFKQKLVAIVKPIPRESVASDPDETLIKQRYSSLSDSHEMNQNLQQRKECDFLSHESFESTLICKYSEQGREDIEHTDEEIKTTENVAEPRFVQNTCQIPDVSLKNCCGEIVRSETEEEFENEDSTGNRQWTDFKSRDRASVSMSNEQDCLYLESVKTIISHYHSVPFTELFLAPVRRLTLSESFESEFRRRETFQNMENRDIFDILVRNGYVYIEMENEIICHLCGGRWREGDIPERSHHPGCQYLDESSPGIHSVYTATALNNGTINEIGEQFFGHLFTEKMTLEVFSNDPRVVDRARNRHHCLGNCGIYERVSQNASCRILDDGGSCMESRSVPRMTHIERFSETPQVEILSFSASQTVEDQLQMLVSYFRRQRDPLGPRGGRNIIVLPPLANNGGKRSRRHITALLPRTPFQESVHEPVQESEFVDDCFTYSYDSNNIQIGNNMDDLASCTRTESLQTLNRVAENTPECVERSYGDLRYIQHLNYLTTAGRKILDAKEGDQKIDKRKCIQSTGRIGHTDFGRYGDENNGSQERRGGDLQHIQRLNYVTTDDANNVSQERRGGDLHHIQSFNYLTTDGRKVL